MTQEAPITVGLLERRIADALGVRATKRIRKQVEARLRTLTKDGQWRRTGDDIYTVGQTVAVVRVPRDSDPTSVRAMEQIPDAELDLAVRSLVADAARTSVDDLMTAIRTLFGFARTGARIRGLLEASIERLLERGAIARADNGDLVPGEGG